MDAGAVRGEAEQNMNDNVPNDTAPAPQPTQRIDVRVSSLEMVTDTEDKQAQIAGGVRLTVRWPEDTATQVADPVTN